jgi:hypothetical protein
MTFGNVEPWAAPVRAVLATLLALDGIVWMWRAHVKLELAQALIVGVLVALVISNSFHTNGNTGFAPWLVFAGAYGAQRAAWRDWCNDLAAFGMVVSWFMVINVLLGAAPAGVLNRNYVSLLIVLAAPAMMERWTWPGWLMAVWAIAVGGSRGALVGLVIGTIVMSDVPRRIKWVAIPAVMTAGLALISVRPTTVMARLNLMRAAISDWWTTSIAFGLGPGGIAVEGWRVGEQFVSHHAHSMPASILSNVGIVGVVIVVALCSLAARRLHKTNSMDRWQWATLASATALAMVEDLAVWWPVGIIICLSSVTITNSDSSGCTAMDNDACRRQSSQSTSGTCIAKHVEATRYGDTNINDEARA